MNTNPGEIDYRIHILPDIARFIEAENHKPIRDIVQVRKQAIQADRDGQFIIA